MIEFAPNISLTSERFSTKLKKSLGKTAVRLTAIVAGAGAIFGINATVESATGHEAAAQAYHVTGAEKAWCRVPSRIRLCIDASDKAGYAEAEASKVANQSGWSIADGGADAVRHCYWNALMTKDFGRETAAGFAYRHEYDDTQNGGQLDMDLHNNMKGRDWADVPDPLQRCIQGVENNELKRLVN